MQGKTRYDFNIIYKDEIGYRREYHFYLLLNKNLKWYPFTLEWYYDYWL